MPSHAHPVRDDNWYTALSLSPSASESEIASAVELMSRQAAALANTAPERSQRLRETVRAIKRDLLSSPQARERYDRSVALSVPPATPMITEDAATLPGPTRSAAPAPPPPPTSAPPAAPPHPGPPPAHAAPPAPATSPAPAAAPPTSAMAPGPTLAEALGPAAAWAQDRGRRFRRFLQGGWTCTACGHGAMPGERFCVKCGCPIEPPGTPAAGPAGAPPAPAAPTAPAASSAATACSACGLAMAAADRFCRRCGTRRQ